MDFYRMLESSGKLKPEHTRPNADSFIFYTQAFEELSSCRPSGLGISSIPFTAVAEYARIFEVEDFHEFLYLIRLMDAELIKLSSKKGRTASGSTNPSPKNSSKG